MKRTLTIACALTLALMAITPLAGPAAATNGFSWEPDIGVGLDQDDDDCDFIAFGFPFQFYGQTYNGVWVNSNGNVTFDDCNTDWSHPDIPDGDNVIIGTLYGDFDPSVTGDVHFNTVGASPDRRFVVTWDAVPEYDEYDDPATNTFQLQLFEATGQIQFGYNGLGTDGINWSPEGEPMDVGISSGTGSYINSAGGPAIPQLDGTNICYTPIRDDYEETRAPCGHVCDAELIPIQVTETQGEFLVHFECPEIDDEGIEISADINGVPVENGQFVELIIFYGPQIVYEFWGEMIIKAPDFLLLVTATNGAATVVGAATPDFSNTTPAIGPPNADAPPPNQPYPPAPPPIRILGPFQDIEAEILQMELAAPGLDFVYESYGFHDELIDAVTGSDPPDVIMAAQPGLILEVQDALIDLGGFFDESELRAAYSDYFIDVVSAGGAILAGPIRADLKSLVWYQPARFEANGYAIPETFAELVALSDQMVANGQYPWCQYMESGFATGWYGTDWVEDNLLGTDGPAVYDQWVAHDVLFSDPRVEDAFTRYLFMLDTPGYTWDRANVLNASFFENAFPLAFGECLMHKQGTFFRSFIVDDPADYATFHFPAVDSAYADRAMGGGSFVATLSDRPEVIELMEYILSPGFGTDTLAAADGWILPHAGFDTGLYGDPLVGSWGEIVQAAVLAGQFRFDGSDLMPPVVGAGTFWTGIAELVAGIKTIPQVLAEIDASWPTTMAFSLLALPDPVECTVELDKLYGYWNQGTFQVHYSCDGPVGTMTADINGHEVADGQMVELVTTWGTERASDMWGSLRIEAPEFLMTLTTTEPDGTWTAVPDF